MGEAGEDVVLLRLGQQRMEGDLLLLKQERANDREQMDNNHRQNRDSVHKLGSDMQVIANNVSLITTQLHNYLLVQSDRDSQHDKVWWRQPLGTAIIVAIISIVMEVLRKKIGW